MEKIKVLLVEDDPMASQLIEIFVTNHEKYRFEGAVSSVAMASEFLASHKVDLVLMDACPSVNADGIAAAAEIKKNMPEIKIIIITSQPEHSFILRAKEARVDSFWYKTVISDEFFSLIDRTMAGERIFPDATPPRTVGQALSVEFTNRELEVLRLVVAGERDHDIAKALGISLPTVKKHIANLKDKTGFNNRTKLAVKVRETGLIITE
jgi:two-component system vancomycin resistance associated response regulator VraR